MAKRKKAATAKKEGPKADADVVVVVDEPESKSAKVENHPPPSATTKATPPAGSDPPVPDDDAVASLSAPPVPDDDAVASLSGRAIAAFRSSALLRCSNGRQEDVVIDHRRFFSECDASGAVERTLWPWFLRLSASSAASADDGGGDDATAPLPGREAAFALAMLSNRRGGVDGGYGGGGGGGGGDPRLYFVVDDDLRHPPTATNEGEGRDDDDDVEDERKRTAAFSSLLRLLLEYQRSHASNDHVDGDNDDALSLAIGIEVLDFLIASYSSMEMRCRRRRSSSHPAAVVPPRRGVIEGPLADLVGVRLWDAVPVRRRRLEMRRDGLLRKRYGLFDSRRRREEAGGGGGGGSGGSIGVGFMPAMVDGLVDAVVALGDGALGGDDADAGGGRRRPVPPTPLLRSYASKALELLLDLMSYPQTRAHVAPYLSSRHVAVLLASSKLYSGRRDGGGGPGGSGPSSFAALFRQQVDLLLDSERAEASSSSSSGDKEATAAPTHVDDLPSRQAHQRAHVLQKLLHRHHAGASATSEVVFAGVGRVCDPRWLRGKIGTWDEGTLYDVCRRLRLVDDGDIDDTSSVAARLGCSRRDLLTSVLLYHQSSRPTDASVLSSAPLYPTEALLWDAHSVPPGDARLLLHEHGGGGGGCRPSLSLPKLNARFLSPGDYLLRNFRLFRLESAYEIRGDIVDVVRRMRPARTQDGYVKDEGDYYGGGRGGVGAADDDDDGASGTEFRGWARMGLQLGSRKRDKPGVRLLRVDPPRLGERVPSQVIAEVVMDLHSCATSLAREWDEVGEFDNLFLICVDAARATGDAAPSMGGRQGGEDRRIPDEEDCTFPRRYGVRAVRGCMVLEVRDEAGTILSDPAASFANDGGEGGVPVPKGKLRFLRVALDPAQYALDASGDGSPLGTGVYEMLNLVVRRSGRENNFKSVLETIRSLMSGGANSIFRSIPNWLVS